MTSPLNPDVTLLLSFEEEVNQALLAPSTTPGGERPEPKDRDDPEYCLHLASLHNNIPLLEEALKKGANPNALLPQDQAKAIERFIKEGNEEAVRLLIDHGARVDNYNHLGSAILKTPLLDGRLNLAKLLVQHGAKWDVTLDEEGSPQKNQGRGVNAPALPEHLLLFLSETTFYRGRTLSDQFLEQILEAFDWPREGRLAPTYRAFLAINLLTRVAENAENNTPNKDQTCGMRLLRLVLQEYKIDSNPSRQDMKRLEACINRDLRKEDAPFLLGDFFTSAIYHDDLPLIEFLIRNNWLESLQSTLNGRSISPIWIALQRQAGRVWSILKNMPGVLEEARVEYNQDPSPFFPLLASLTLEELGKIKSMRLNWLATDAQGNTFFHHLASYGIVLKGHLHFASETLADEAFSMKNKDGDTPFNIGNQQGNAERKELQSYFEQIILPKALRRQMKDAGNGRSLPQATRRRM